MNIVCTLLFLQKYSIIIILSVFECYCYPNYKLSICYVKCKYVNSNLGFFFKWNKNIGSNQTILTK